MVTVFRGSGREEGATRKGERKERRKERRKRRKKRKRRGYVESKARLTSPGGEEK